jgi:anaerobic selenocysteine-containing dehydrogenase
MWALTARLKGTNNLPDSSNMCHESTSVGLLEAIGSAVGTTTIEDLDEKDCIFSSGRIRVPTRRGRCTRWRTRISAARRLTCWVGSCL